MSNDILDQFWITFCGVLVLLMQVAFLCLESGSTRSKNSTNVAMKNAADFVVAILFFWLIGFGLMFGGGELGLFGTDHFALELGQGRAWDASFFLFQAMFCATAVTIVSGAVAERMRFNGYLLVSLAIAGCIYPIAGHWSWAGIYSDNQGWLEAMGFVDFAGSTVVHSVGGWVALACVLLIGPRKGRFVNGKVVEINSSNPTLVLLGVLFFVVGWIGFNGGSTLSLNDRVPGIITNTIIAAVTGSATAYILNSLFRERFAMDQLLAPCNGLIAGLVSITAVCHAVTTKEAFLIGAVGALIMLLLNNLLLRYKIDDAVSAIPVHLGAGIWGTLSVVLFGDPEILATGLSFGEQLGVQLLGIIVTGLWSFGLAIILIMAMNRIRPLRVSAADEHVGLNIAEHGARNDLTDLLDAMQAQQNTIDISKRIPVDPFTEVGQIAERYNQVMSTLEKAVNQTQAIVRDIRDAIVTFGVDGIITSFNPGAEKIFQISAQTAVGENISHLLYEDKPAIYGHQSPEKVVDRFELNERHEVQGKRAGNEDERFHLELTITESLHQNDRQYTALIRDVNEKKQIEARLFRQHERAMVTLGSIADGVITTDAEGRVRYVNQAAENLTGWGSEAARGQLFHDIYLLSDETTDQSRSLVGKVLRGQSAIFENPTGTLKSKNGEEFAITHTAAPIKDNQNTIFGVVVVFHDVTATREMQRQLVHQASHDALTGLPNRIAFEQYAGELIIDAISNQNEHMLGYLDLDQFKLVNDTCGHVAGDELLRRIAQLIKSQLRQDDIIARLGGDEFGILLSTCSSQDGTRIAEKIRQSIADFRFPWEDNVFAIGGSIGLVNINAMTESLPQLLSIADAACYMAKDSGRNRVHLYQPDDIEMAQRRGQMQWVTKIRRALDQDQFRLYYQEIEALNKDGKTDQAAHYEIFIRMIDEHQGIIPPGAFIPAAERYDLIQEIDLWVVKNTLAWLGDHLRNNPNSVKLCCINLSGASIGNEATLTKILAYIERYKVDPTVLCFEITETAAVANLESAKHFIQALRTIGCKFALDDFGCGLSSFAYLRDLTVDYLKIDGVFVKDMDTQDVDRVMVESINSIGHQMGLQTIAEFVGSQAVVDELAKIGVDYVQGYFVAKPKPLEDLEGVAFMPR